MATGETSIRQNREALDAFEERIEYLRVSFDRYFHGVDRMPPNKELVKVKRLMRELLQMHWRSTQGRFRFNTLRARLITHEQYWNRILHQIEKGTYKRLLAEGGRRERVAAQAAKDARNRAGDTGPEADSPGNGDPARPRRGPPSAPPQLPDGMNAKEARDLFKAFVAAKRAAGERTKGLTYGALVKKLAREAPKLTEKHGASVQFEVATVNGKVRLRARGR